jgi:hypothetical protein
LDIAVPRIASRVHQGYGDGPGPPTTGAKIIASTLNEVSHHGTQVCMLRDLYRFAGGAALRADAD